MNRLVTLALLFSATTVFAIEIPAIMIESSKLDEPVLDASQSVIIIDQKKIDNFHIKDVKDLSSIVSNTNISGMGSRTNRTFTFRGISNYVTFESSVAMYIDDAPVPFSFGYGLLDMHNIHKIEVLKGPQGTQFGKSAESAVINIYTKPTTKTFQGEASVDFGTYNSKDFYGRISGPMGNKDFSYAFSISKSSQDGFSENLLSGERIDDRELSSFSAKLNYNPSTPWNIALNYTKNKADDGGSAFKSDTKDNPYKINDKLVDDESIMDTDLLSLIIKYKTYDYTFTSATSYAKQDILKNNYANAIGGLLINLDVEIEEFTQELRLKYSFESIDLLIGAMYSNKLSFDYKENMYSYLYDTSSKNILQNPDENTALFTEIKYWLDSHYAVTAGIRYQETKRSFKRNLNNFFQPTIAAESSKKWTHALPTLSLSYYTDDYSHTYLRYAKGYRPGGYNYRVPGTNLVPFKPEITDSFELGHKQKLSSELSFSGAIFYNDINNHRTVTFNDNLATTVVNAKKAYSYGAELDLSYETEKLLLHTSIGVTEAKFKDSDTTNDYKGNHLVDVPDMTAAVGATYSFNTNWFIQPSARYMGKRYYDIENIKKEDGYTTVDLSLGYKNPKGYKAVMYATNILDKENVDFVIHTPSHNYYHFSNPRVLGFKLSKSF